MKNMTDQVYDCYIMEVTRWRSTGEVRRARRQLNRKWARRNPARRRNHISSYCLYVDSFGFLTGDPS